MPENTFFRDESEPGIERVFYVKTVDREKSLLLGVVVQEYDEGGCGELSMLKKPLMREESGYFKRGLFTRWEKRGK